MVVVVVVVGTCLKRLRAHKADKSPVSFVLIYAPTQLDLTLFVLKKLVDRPIK